MQDNNSSHARRIPKENFTEGHIRVLMYQESQRAIADYIRNSKANQTKDGDEYLSVDDVAKMLGVKRDTVLKMNGRQVIPFSKPNKYPRYLKSDVLKHMQKHRAKSMEEIKDDADDYSLF